MDPITVVILSLIFLLVLILSGVYVSIALATCSIIGLWLITGNFNTAVGVLQVSAFSALKNYSLAVVPLFIIMGLLSNFSDASRDLYQSAYLLLRRVRGGLAIATVFANAIFAAITGSSVVSAAVFSKISLPQMEAHGYDRKFALGTVAGSSVLGMLIPPSVLFIVYGTLAEVGIGNLFIAGIIPGLVMTGIYSIGILLRVRLNPKLVKEVTIEAEKSQERILAALIRPWPLYAMIVLVLGGIYIGWFTPTEAGAVGAFGMLILVIAKGRFNLEVVKTTLLETGYTCASIFLLIISATMFSNMLARSGFSEWITSLINATAMPNIGVILLFVFILFLMGCILDSISIFMLTTSLMVPIIQTMGYDVIWWGVVMTVTVELGILTPPFGLAVYTIKSSLGDEVALEDIFSGTMFYLLMMIICLAIFIAFPILSLCLLR